MQLILKKKSIFKIMLHFLLSCVMSEKNHLQALAQAFNIKCIDIHCLKKNGDVKKKLGTSHITSHLKRKNQIKKEIKVPSYPFLS